MSLATVCRMDCRRLRTESWLVTACLVTTAVQVAWTRSCQWIWRQVDSECILEVESTRPDKSFSAGRELCCQRRVIKDGFEVLVCTTEWIGRIVKCWFGEEHFGREESMRYCSVLKGFGLKCLVVHLYGSSKKVVGYTDLNLRRQIVAYGWYFKAIGMDGIA